MKNAMLRAGALCVLALLVSAAFAHGLNQDPPSRNWFCGFVTISWGPHLHGQRQRRATDAAGHLLAGPGS